MGPSLPAHGWPRTLTTPLLVSRASRERSGAITLHRTRPRYTNLGCSASNCPSLHEVLDTRQVVAVCSHYKSPGRFVNQKHNYLGNRIQSLKRHVTKGSSMQPREILCNQRRFDAVLGQDGFPRQTNSSFPPDDFLGIVKIVIDLFSGFGIVNELARASLWLGSSVGRAGD